MPQWSLKNLPKADWSANPSISATCCTERSGLRKHTLASRASSSDKIVLADFPYKRFSIADKESADTPVCRAYHPDVPQLILPGTDHNLQQLVSKEIAILL